jgi:hypothetical protein
MFLRCAHVYSLFGVQIKIFHYSSRIDDSIIVGNKDEVSANAIHSDTYCFLRFLVVVLGFGTIVEFRIEFELPIIFGHPITLGF